MRHTVVMPNEDWERLAQAVADRIAALDIKQSDIPTRGGPSPAKVREITNRRTTTLSASKRRDLERALEWQLGSIDTVLAGGDPTPIDGSRQQKQLPQMMSGWHELIATHTRLLVDLAIEADEVDSSASFLNTDVSEVADVEQLLGELDSLLIDIDRLTQHINDEAVSWVGDFEALRALKSDTLRRRRLRRLGRTDVGPDLVTRMQEIGTELRAAGLGEGELARRIVAEAKSAADQYAEPDIFEVFAKTKETNDAVPAAETASAGASGEADQGQEVTRLPHWGADTPPPPVELADAASRGEKQSDFDDDEDDV